MKKKLLCLAITCLLCMSCQPIFAGGTLYMTNATDGSDTYDVYLDNSDTDYDILNMSNGRIDDLCIYGNGVANITYGVLNSIDSNGDGIANFYDGEILGDGTGIDSWDSSKINIFDGDVSSINAWNTSEITISGGNVNSLFTYNGSTANIKGSASVEMVQAYSNNANDFSTVNIEGGTIGMMDAYDDSLINLYVVDFELELDTRIKESGISQKEWFTYDNITSGSTLEDMFVYDFLLNDYLGMTISGTWADGNIFDIALGGNELDSLNSIGMNIVAAIPPTPAAVPVPGAAMLVGFGLLSTSAIRRLRRP